MAELETLLLLSELINFDDESHWWSNSRLGEAKAWKRLFNNIKELRVEDRFGFREMFRMDVTDFENVLKVGAKINF